MNIKSAVLILIAFLFCGCSADTQPNEKITVLCTTFPQYDWTKNIVGDLENIEVRLLIENGTDIHSFQPSAEDMAEIYESSLLIYNGGVSEQWLDDAVKKSKLENIDIIEVLGESALNEETVEGMQTDEADNDEIDEHLWLSVKNAEKICSVIAERLCNIDSENALLYKENAQNYINRLDELDKQFEETGKKFDKPVVFADRFPFLYMMKDYGIDYYAVFSGCSAETNASFETIIFISQKIDEYGISAVGVTESADKSVADAIIENTTQKNQSVVVFDSMQSVKMSDIENGTDYITVMKQNLESLKKLL